MQKEIILTDLITLEAWERIQDHFASVLNVSMRTIDNHGNAITRPSNPTRICQHIIAHSPAGITKCGRCLPSNFGDLSNLNQWKDGFQCYLGMYTFCIPVMLSEENVIAHIIIGPIFLGQRRQANHFTQKADELNIPMDEFIDFLSEIKLFSFTGIRSVIDLINDIVSNVASLGYSRLKLERVIPLPKIGKIVHKFHMDRILSALLEISFNTTNASVGSIMLIDEDSGELHIRIAKGLAKDVIKDSRLKLGEGVAGYIAEQKKSVLIDTDCSDPQIKSRLSRPTLTSSFVAPFKINGQPLGVMNVGTFSTSNRITAEKAETLQRLIELTESTLSDLISF